MSTGEEKFLDRNFFQLSEPVVPLIMHCITLPCGEEVFWKTVNSQFTDSQWQERFKAGKWRQRLFLEFPIYALFLKKFS